MSTTEINVNELGSTLRKSTLLVELRRSIWTAQANDRTAVEDVRQSNRAQGDIGRFRKNLMAGADKELKAIQSLMQLAYRKHQQMTLAFSVKALRLIPVKRLGTYMGEMTELNNKLQPLVDAFVANYEPLRDQAKAHLGDLFDPREYPSVGSIRTRFRMDVKLHPVPSSVDWRELPVGDAGVQALAAHTSEMLNEAMGSAIEELRERVETWVKRALEALPPDPEDPTKPAKAFHGTLVTDLHRIAEDLVDFNLSGDPEITELAGFARQAADLVGTEVDGLRASPQLRQDLFLMANDMRTCMEAYQTERDAS